MYFFTHTVCILLRIPHLALFACRGKRNNIALLFLLIILLILIALFSEMLKFLIFILFLFFCILFLEKKKTDIKRQTNKQTNKSIFGDLEYVVGLL
jgi:lysylphosphatidylglycerol synthetase-like protein (DUF2156 family)